MSEHTIISQITVLPPCRHSTWRAVSRVNTHRQKEVSPYYHGGPQVIKPLYGYQAAGDWSGVGEDRDWPQYTWHWPSRGGHLARQHPGSGYLKKEHSGGRFMDGSLSLPGSLSFITAEQRCQAAAKEVLCQTDSSVIGNVHLKTVI
ncbi:unnamed protein product [Pleuronectes platessa]|uniref:Uncharacterized protein n=1 Tax=Pleuronectes platessa TaxID=8262 RepID=A0A9N7VBJ5_PLEPL|nr:unnamed protein product [Pleuronectes platessa]